MRGKTIVLAALVLGGLASIAHERARQSLIVHLEHLPAVQADLLDRPIAKIEWQIGRAVTELKRQRLGAFNLP